MKNRKEIKLQWTIIQCWYTLLALVTVIITGEWLMFWAIIIVCLGYGMGWYRCWKFHKIGWDKQEQLPGGDPPEKTTPHFADSACNITEAITGLLEPEDDDEDTVKEDKG